MTHLQIRFKPLDTLFFRDGSPFNREELQANVNTIFPPSPTTLAGAIRAAWARAMGWDGKGRGGNWAECCKERLGASVTLPETITFNGPYLFRNNEPVFPVPAHVLGVTPLDPQKQKPSDLVLLAPGREMETDLGKILLPVKPSSGTVEARKALITEWWVSACGLRQILRGDPPGRDTLMHQSKLWTVEQRIGNFRKEGRVTGLMALYSPQHIRLQQGVELAMFSSGLPDIDIEKIISRPAVTGGEARACWLTIEEGGIEGYLQIGSPSSSMRYTLVALTPTQVDSLGNIAIKGRQPVSYCNQRPLMLGGWDCNKPRELRPCLRPGSVLFMETEHETAAGKIISYGEKTQWGFGRFVTGIWK
ncbi:MAG: hypothetical protein L3J49_13790 [Desulfobulbaceae bacterium]|nr:hypothetical protein [Desulfobulbaceae bacterium]